MPLMLIEILYVSIHKRLVSRRLLAGCYPGDSNISEMDKKLNALLDCGMRTFLNLMETDEVDHSGLKFHPL
jgi:hypothetical protein